MTTTHSTRKTVTCGAANAFLTFSSKITQHRESTSKHLHDRRAQFLRIGINS
jgi:hypothetical protein